VRRLLSTLTITAVAAGALVLAGIPAQAEQCDSMTGGGSINTTANQTHPLARARFTIAGGCKDGTPTWGHFGYTDEGNGLDLTWTSITAYIWAGDEIPGGRGNQPRGTRIICGTATTNLFGDVEFGLVAHDGDDPGTYDGFIIRLRKAGVTVYTTEEPGVDVRLGGSGGRGGGNIQLHKPNSRSSSGSFGGSCPAFF
jgi:hypothetical protein